MKSDSVKAGTTGNIVLKAEWNEDCLLVDGTNGEGHFATIADALNAAKAKYEECYGPLTIEGVDTEKDGWSWINGPWPWEGEC